MELMISISAIICYIIMVLFAAFSYTEAVDNHRPQDLDDSFWTPQLKD